MKQLFYFLFFLCLAVRLPAQTITAAEYFFDADPGPGLGTPIAIGSPAAAVTFSANISTGSLSPGFHTLAIRAKDGDGKWGPFEWRTVYLSSAQTNAEPITAAEFFIGDDPGPGNGTVLGIGAPGHAVQFSALIPTASLQPGFHMLAIRTRNASGQWSHFEARGFYLASAPVAAQAITAAEYYIDTDPGPGNGTPLPVGTSGNAVTFTALLPTTSLSSGFHRLAIRAKTADGTWGIVETSGFYIQPASTNMGEITQAEYFLDTDPGVGNGTPLTFTTPGNTVTLNFMVPIPASMPNGQHLLAVRVKDANGVWGLLEWREITVSGFPLPLDWLSFTGRRKENAVALQWTTANENNTSHFEVERSVNGIDFRRIGQTTAKGGVHNDYQFTDAAPVNGLNFYRLRQVDKNGAFKYSAVIKVYFGDAGVNTLKLFPQPVTHELNIVFGGSGREVLIQVYDATGKLVRNERKQNLSAIQLPTDRLSKGTYWIVVSDGITQQKGQFVKQ